MVAHLSPYDSSWLHRVAAVSCGAVPWFLPRSAMFAPRSLRRSTSAPGRAVEGPSGRSSPQRCRKEEAKPVPKDRARYTRGLLEQSTIETSMKPAFLVAENQHFLLRDAP